MAWEGRKGGYEDFKRMQLGDDGYEALERLHHTTMKRDDAIIKFMQICST